MALNDIMPVNKGRLEKIAQEVRTLPKDFSKISRMWGPCGFEAKEVAERLRAAFPKDKFPKYNIRIYTFSEGVHTIATIGKGDNFNDAWKIDLEKKKKIVYAPGEKYWAADRKLEDVTDNKYFAL